MQRVTQAYQNAVHGEAVETGIPVSEERAGIGAEEISFEAFDNSALANSVRQALEAEEITDDHFIAFESLINASEKIESLVATVEGLDAPLDLNSAMFLNIAAESILDPIQMDMEDAPSLESFALENDNVEATRLTGDALKQKLKAIGTAIVEMLKQVWAKLKQFIHNVLDTNQHLKTKAEELRDRASKLGGDTKPNREKLDEVGTYVSRLLINGQVATIESGLQNVAFLVEDMGKEPEEGKDSGLLNLANKVLDADDNAAVDAAIENLKHLTLYPPRAFSKQSRDGNGGLVHSTPVLPGNVTFSILSVSADNSQNGLKYLEDLVGSMSHFQDTNEGQNQPTELKVLTPKEITEVAGTVSVIVESVEGLSKRSELTERLIDTVFAKLVAKSHNFREDLDEAHAIMQSNAVKTIARFKLNASRHQLKAAAYCIQIARAYLKYAQDSFQAYAEKPAEDKTEEVAK